MDSIQRLRDTIQPLNNSRSKTYCFGIDFRLLFLVSVARTTGMNMSAERQRHAIGNHFELNQYIFSNSVITYYFSTKKKFC